MTVLHPTDTHYLKMVKMVHFMICIFYHNKKESRVYTWGVTFDVGGGEGSG